MARVVLFADAKAMEMEVMQAHLLGDNPDVMDASYAIAVIGGTSGIAFVAESKGLYPFAWRVGYFVGSVEPALIQRSAPPSPARRRNSTIRP